MQRDAGALDPAFGKELLVIRSIGVCQISRPEQPPAQPRLYMMRSHAGGRLARLHVNGLFMTNNADSKVGLRNAAFLSVSTCHVIAFPRVEQSRDCRNVSADSCGSADDPSFPTIAASIILRTKRRLQAR